MTHVYECVVYVCTNQIELNNDRAITMPWLQRNRKLRTIFFDSDKDQNRTPPYLLLCWMKERKTTRFEREKIKQKLD